MSLPGDTTIAIVDGRPIDRSRIVDLLLESHGVGLLEQLVVLDRAEDRARKKGLVISSEDIANERSRALGTLSDPLDAITGGNVDSEKAERLLTRVLADRNVSRTEFDLVVRRNATLRVLVLADQVISDQELREEYERSFGPTVTVRHLQMATMGEVRRVQQQLAEGTDFAELARTYSANRASGERGGLLDPFTQYDDRVPEALRTAAFVLELGGVSDPIRIGAWYHLLKLEQRHGPSSTTFEAARGTLVRRLQDRYAEPAMRALYQELFDGTTIQIRDPVLKRSFERVHPDRRGG